MKRSRYPYDCEMWGGILCRYCARCQEWWPATAEFFFRKSLARGGALMRECVACYSEREKPSRKRPQRSKALHRERLNLDAPSGT